MAIDGIDFNKICRTCLIETTISKDLFDVQYVNEENLILSEILRACTSLEVEKNDGLPNQVCFECVHYMLSSFSFLQRCHKSDSTLKAFLSEASQSRILQAKSLNPFIENIKKLSLGKHEKLGNNFLQNKAPENTPNEEVNTVIDLTNDEVCHMDNEAKNIDNRANHFIVNQNNGNNSVDNAKFTDLEIKLEIQEHLLETNYQIDRDVHDDETRHPLVSCEETEHVDYFTTKNNLNQATTTHSDFYSDIYPLIEDISSKKTQQGKRLSHKEDNHLKKAKKYLRSVRSDTSTSNSNKKPTKRKKRRSKLHIKVKSNQFICKLCNKTCSQKIHLDGHLLSKHRDIPDVEKHVESKVHNCKYCSYLTVNKFALALHLFKKHKEKNSVYKSQVKIFRCYHCKYSTVVKGNLILHLRRHTLVRLFPCMYCSHSFNQKKQLDKHIQSHLKNGSVIPLKDIINYM